MNTSATPLQSQSLMDGIHEGELHGMVILSPADRKPFRRVMYVNSYGGKAVWKMIKDGIMVPHHLYGCLELVKRGYEVILAEPLADFYWHRRPFPHDLKLLRVIRQWLGDDGIVFCGHNVLYWLPFLSGLKALRCRIVSLLFAREPLNLARFHHGIIGLNPAASEHARRLAPKAKVRNLAWGVHLPSFPQRICESRWFLSCGLTQRDHHTLCTASTLGALPVRILASAMPAGLNWPSHVKLINRSLDALMPHEELVCENFAPSHAVLIILKEDKEEATGCGFTNLIEAMAMGRPVIVTRTGAVPSELDIEKEGCGLWVKPNDPVSLANAMTTLAHNPDLANTMGQRGRALVERRYNIDRFATELHQLFEEL